MKKSDEGALKIVRAGPVDLPRLLALYQYLTPEDAPLPPDEAAERLAAFHAMKDSGLFVGYLPDG
ncbi:hypothetical protein [uncultured Cohaesibacter sp.]|uniref:hypothetical protein n=1 Tax=uncultured Cohaesibacter sp. TaxID=1002546 RepID=UPI0029C83990|nr:hypothetical protein [uncultured Cohaesibacter sp.]